MEETNRIKILIAGVMIFLFGFSLILLGLLQGEMYQYAIGVISFILGVVIIIDSNYLQKLS